MTYTIGEVAELTGVPAVTLRAWENRYGVVRPGRTASSYRQYDERDLETLQRMRALVDSGVPPRRAAQLAASPASHSSQTSAGVPEAPLQDVTALARAGAALDNDALRRILDEAFAVTSIETAVDAWLVPSMHEVGRSWESGELDVVSEHLVSAAVMRKLSALFDTTPARGPRVVVGLPAANRHELPALAFALLLQRLGTQVLYVGADVPESCWTRLAEVWQPDAAVIGVACTTDIERAHAAVRALLAAEVETVYVGGRDAHRVPGAIPLVSSLTASAQTVAAALAHRGNSRHRRTFV
ncbi:MerR family transcriptional regulator [Flexivirga lutea]